MDISELLSSLSPDDISKLKGVASELLSGQSSLSDSKPQESPQSTPDLFSLMGKLSSDDERTAFLKSLRPLLSEARQKKTDEAIKILRLLSLLPLLRESGLLNNIL